MLTYLLSLLADERDKIILTNMYRQYEQLTLRVAMAVLRNTQDAEDATMAAWTKVVDHFDTAKARFARSREAFEPWLTLITKNAARDECRRRKRAPQPIEMRDIPSSADTEREAAKRMAIELIQSMPDQLRTPLEMRMFGGYGFKEIGKSLGCSADTAQRRFERAREVLKERIEAGRGAK